MQVLYERCAGLDVHKKTVVVTVLITQSKGTVQKLTRTFSTMTADLLTLDEWLRGLQVIHLALESTGVYWHPVFNILEEGRSILLVNPQHMRAVPGRKTDVKDSEWLADLHRHGLLKASFIPPKPIRELRELTRYRKTLVQERAQEVNRLQKVLEGANVKLAAVATDVLGKSGRQMLEALIDGVQDAEALSALARGRLRAKLPELRKALDGRVQPQHRFLLTRMLAHIDFLEESLEQVNKEIEQQLAPFEEAMTLAQSVIGIQETAAAAILAEIGTDMSRFPTASHLASWAGVCPGNKQSGGKRHNGATTLGNAHLRAVLGEVAWAIAHTRDNYLSAQYHRIARRRGKQKAIVAVSHSVLVILYHVLRNKQPYHDLGADYFAKLDTARTERHHVHQLEQLGYRVILAPKEVA
ncbi:IS110 family transposase [Reticulibacter mediterranei]|uniref:IS110 family transposase n=1 Tax=Reticulibacter mediterranei TaxID=2778369 RepID=A0A8J3N6G9_9CHLR|nr:IS110 family transposase [Reticulibacter mediterranei]GHO97538.1 IS110 family transposase [Reticulibacter mediterranei]